ncbi:MAG TPA: NADH-quinone oxidoreductase subunit L, partial [Marmoricola sp.]|nr:NADH-quinone oxidoreductase subunit L [Marmoricola sp.]
MLTPLLQAVPVVSPEQATGAFNLLWLLIALPAAGALVLLVGGRRTDRWGHLLGTATVLGSFVIGLILFFTDLGRAGDHRAVHQHLWTFFETGSYKVNFDILFDQLSAVFVLLITGVGSLIHIYSIGYMEHDARRRRFFGY